MQGLWAQGGLARGGPRKAGVREYEPHRLQAGESLVWIDKPQAVQMEEASPAEFNKLYDQVPAVPMSLELCKDVFGLKAVLRVGLYYSIVSLCSPSTLLRLYARNLLYSGDVSSYLKSVSI